MCIHLYIGRALRWNLLWILLQSLKTCKNPIRLHDIRSHSTATSDHSSLQGRRNHPPEASQDGEGGVTYRAVPPPTSECV